MKALALLAVLVIPLRAEEPAPVLRLEHIFDAALYSYNPIFSRDGKTFAVDSSGVAIFDAATGIQRSQIPPPEACSKKDDNISCARQLVGLSPDGTLAAIDNFEQTSRGSMPKDQSIPYDGYSAERKGELELWDVASAAKIRTLHKYKTPCRQTGSAFQPFASYGVDGLTFSPDGQRMAFIVATGKKDWRSEGREYYVVTLEGKKRELKGSPFFAPDGRLMTLPVKRGSPEVRDEDAGKRVSFLQGFNPYGGLEWGWKISADGSAASARFLGEEWKPNSVQAWDIATGKVLYTKFDGASKDEDVITQTLMSPDGRWLLMLRESSGKVLADVNDLRGSTALETQVLDLQGSQMELSADGRLLAGNHKVAETSRLAVFHTHWKGDGAAPVAKSAPPAAPLVDVDVPPAAKTAANPDAYAVVIGIEKYRQEGLPAVDYAARDAETMQRYLIDTMGFEPANVILLQNERATKTDLEKYLGPWLANRVTEKSRVFIYYAGHGAPNPATGQGYLVPYEGDPNYTDVTAYPIQRLYDGLAKLATADVTVVLDACFSGSGGRSLLAKGARPLVTTVKTSAGSNTTILSAASGAQVSASYPPGRHGLLSYFLFEGLHGAADANNDGSISTAELFAHARLKVQREARKQNLEQTPELSGSDAGIWLRR